MYDELDKAIIESVKEGDKRFIYILVSPIVRDMCNSLAKEKKREPFRILDARLQALRKRGILKFASKTGWALATQYPNDCQCGNGNCSECPR